MKCLIETIWDVVGILDGVRGDDQEDARRAVLLARFRIQEWQECLLRASMHKNPHKICELMREFLVGDP